MNHMHVQREADLLEAGRGEEKRKESFPCKYGINFWKYAETEESKLLKETK